MPAAARDATLGDDDVARLDRLRDAYRRLESELGRVIIGLARIETMARASRLATVTLQAWGNRTLFYDQPTFGKGRKRGDA